MSSPATRGQGRQSISHRHKFEGHTEAVRQVVHLPCGKRIITCSLEGSLRTWGLENGKQIGYLLQGNRGISAMALSPDGMKLVTGGQDGAMKLWNIKIEKVTVVAKWIAHTPFMVTSVCWSRDSRKVVSASWDGTAREWDGKSGDAIFEPIKTGIDRVQAVVYSPDVALIATGGYHYGDEDVFEFIKIWDSKTHKLIISLQGNIKVDCLAWTKDGKTLVSGFNDGSVKTWNTSTWTQIAVMKQHTNRVMAIALSPNGRILASVSTDGTAYLWDFERGRTVGSAFQRAKKLTCVSFSADGKLLTTGCGDNTYTWDVPAIVKQSGLENLLSDNTLQAKSILDTNVMGRPAQPLRDIRSKLPQGFFDDARDHTHSPPNPPPRSSASYPSPSSALRLKLFSRVSSLFRHSWHPPRVEVPYTRGLARNVKVRRQPMNKPLVAENIMNINIVPPSQPPNGAGQQSTGEVQGQQPLSQPQVLPTTPAAAAAPTTTSVTETPSSFDVIVKRAGRWTRVRLFLCCISVENAATPG